MKVDFAQYNREQELLSGAYHMGFVTGLQRGLFYGLLFGVLLAAAALMLYIGIMR